ncbi:isoprenylcysteine carboxylmethyltransferase family protein [Virgibacillus sp. C22-A2]|uniref:Isoprenylcysteine carboxylmethyltransferase family protein n=1 Tax=Virgibacillus tibetensis TaxID=3042313 RepID=A0ABU6KB00_9BACI|nr:isoprenylcysteine carboxylmethyltransferase family protein [Virgibacillus sp. C22-A2]
MELKIARENEIWLKERGGVLKEERRYRWSKLLYMSFLVSIFWEATTRSVPDLHLNYFLLFILSFIIGGKIWCIYSLKKFWNLKQIVVPGVYILKKGPYKYAKQPYNIFTIASMFITPLIFGAYISAFVYPILYIILSKISLTRKEPAFSKVSL